MAKTQTNTSISKFRDALKSDRKKKADTLQAYSKQILIASLLLIAIVMLFPSGKSYQFADLKEGEIYVGDQIVAQFTFSINKPEDVYAKEVLEAKAAVAPVFVRNDSAETIYLSRIEAALDSMHTILRAEWPDSAKNRELNALLDFLKVVDKNDVVSFFAQEVILNEPENEKRKSKRQQEQSVDKFRFSDVRERLLEISRDIYAIGLLNIEDKAFPNASAKIAIDDGKTEFLEEKALFSNLTTINDRILEKLRIKFSEDSANVVVKPSFAILSALIRPNLIYQNEETENRIAEAEAGVPRARGTVLEKEKIIDSNVRVTADHVLKLNSYARAIAERDESTGGLNFLLPLSGRLTIALLSLTILAVYLFLVKRRVFDNARQVLMVAVSLLLVLVLSHFMNSFSLPIYLLPIAICPALLTIFLGAEVGFMGTVTLALLLGGLRGNEFSIAFMTFIVGSTSVLSVRLVRSRSWLFKSIVWITAGFVVSIIALELLRYSSAEELGRSLLYGVVNGFLSPIFIYGFMVIYEYVFDMTTDATLLELSDLNKPLLRELALRAPGTYHHSILVGSLSEAAAEAIGANSLLARVGAYYHDIGKMDKPEYFVENQQGRENPHEKLSPRMSYLIIANHVKRGLELAKEYGLPREIQAVISEHHGTSLVSYFYEKASTKSQKETKKINESDFRYLGPKPQSKETGIVMLADSVEASSRTLKEPTVTRIRNLVNGIIDDRFKNSELDDSPLTLKDLTKIQNAFIQILTGAFHGRVEYPDQNKITGYSIEEKAAAEPAAKSVQKETVPANGQNV